MTTYVQRNTCNIVSLFFSRNSISQKDIQSAKEKGKKTTTMNTLPNKMTIQNLRRNKEFPRQTKVELITTKLT